MNPEDAERLGISHGETVEVEGIDTAYKGNAQITVTKKLYQDHSSLSDFQAVIESSTWLITPIISSLKKGLILTGTPKVMHSPFSERLPITVPYASTN